MSKYTKKARELHWLFVPVHQGLRIAQQFKNKQWRPHAEYVYNNPTTIFAHRGQRHEDGSYMHTPRTSTTVLFFGTVKKLRSSDEPKIKRRVDVFQYVLSPPSSTINRDFPGDRTMQR